MGEFIAREFYGNTVLEWAIAFGIIIAAFLGGKILYWISGTVIKKLTQKTETRLDDILVDMIEEPIVFALTIAGIWYGLRTLTLPEAAHAWIGNGIQFLVVLAAAWMMARVLDAIFRDYLVPLADKTENDLDDQLLPIVRKGTKLAVWSLGIIVALNNAGYDVGALIAGLGIGGLALAMAAKDTVSNIFGGFTIFTDRPFTLNDRVKVAGFDGTIVEIGIRSTRLQDPRGHASSPSPTRPSPTPPVENVSAGALPQGRLQPRPDLRHHAGADGAGAWTLLKEIAASNDGPRRTSWWPSTPSATPR